MRSSGVPSPCIKACRLDDDRCTGCSRTLEEIIRWRDMSDHERQQVIERLAAKAVKTAN